jgi:cutinase
MSVRLTPVKASTRCPSTKIVISGYSQGAQVAHNAAQRITAAAAARVAAGKSSPIVSNRSLTNRYLVVVFGDPKKGQSFGSIPTSKVLTVCHTGDNICEGGSSITAAHLNYQRDAPTAAQFVAARV